ncbi:ABC transporter permease [Pseudomonas typographi]|uniref:ABC transporter permease n=1 Tax=Pseudomonas typographi TaxID=2715964 RepID=UPI0016854343|nr:ABC transporter permease [Pseudomonas typographi]MBD1551480.1 ABC transporter permease [Pseudomonas typographi]MBD1587534.1 ABC transporter permease [Pseudomonas typographi]
MKKYLFLRIGSALVTLWLMSVLVFVSVRLIGDPTHLLLPPEATEQDRQALREQMGLTKPLPVQYLIYAGNLLKGDIGTSFVTGQPATVVIGPRIVPSVLLAAAALLLSLAAGVPAGIVAACNPAGATARIGNLLATLGLATPAFFVALLLIRWLSVDLRWLPTNGYGTLAHLVIPAVSLSLYSAAALYKLTQSTMGEILQSDFIRFARIKGISLRSVIYKHALKNASLPIITFCASQFGLLIAGAVSVEVIFGWPGIGGAMIDAISQFDYTVIQAVALIVVLLFVVINLIVDVLYGWLDPRIRLAH